MHIRLSQRAGWAGGQPISDLMSRALENPHLISLAAGFVDQQTLPVEPTRRALEAVFASEAEARTALQYGSTPGFVPLREQILERIRETDGPEAIGPPPTLEQIVLTAGSNQLLHLVAESLMDPGDIAICTSPTYLVFLGTVKHLGGRAVGVAMDAEGMIPDSLDQTLRRLERAGELPRVKLIYLVPYFDNPCGVTTSQTRRAEIVELARRWSKQTKIHVIEDAAYRELRYAGEDVPSTRTVDPDGDTVVVAGTFSKSYSPGIRVGWGVLPKHLIRPVCDLKGNIDFGSPNFAQHMMAKVLEQGKYAAHVESVRAGYREKLQAMLESAEEHFARLPGVEWRRPQGGLYVWATLPETIGAGPAGRLFNQAIREGVFYVPGEFCYPPEGEPIRKSAMRLSFGVQSPDRIRQGMAALARAIEHVM
ncbi:MAG: PLP-dependent aminotransferase family protein [Planctomycetes bacterium]|nr:PLP-dependent aminotransferase family protein [Planctomycetota bacterium]